jgi:hypothetical protein
MQTTKQPAGLHTAAPDYVTLAQQAINKVTGFDQLDKELDRAINVTGKTRRHLLIIRAILLTLHFITTNCL